MSIHNESLIRVVYVARGVGAMLIAGGLLFVALGAFSVIRHSSQPWPWTVFVDGLSGLVVGGTLLFSALRLDQGRAWAFYTITAIAAGGIIWSGVLVLLSLSPGPALVLLMMLIVSTACGIAWPQVSILRQRKTYAPLSPVASSTVVIPPPPARVNEPLQP